MWDFACCNGVNTHPLFERRRKTTIVEVKYKVYAQLEIVFPENSNLIQNGFEEIQLQRGCGVATIFGEVAKPKNMPHESNKL